MSPNTAGMAWVPGGTFRMGSDQHYPEEGPAHLVTVGGFWMDRHTVTNAEFLRFVEETGHRTLAERAVNADDYPGAKPELLVPASVVFRRPRTRVDLRNHLEWWTYVPGANWRHPRGPDSDVEGRDHHPVVHVSHEDAAAYARWTGKELPTEAEWERAAGGGPGGRRGGGPRGGGWRGWSTSGATSSSPRASQWPTSGRASSRSRRWTSMA